VKRLEKITQLVFSRRVEGEDCLEDHPERTGGTSVPMEEIHFKAHQPLPRTGERLKLADCNPFPLPTVMFDEVRLRKMEMPKLKEEKDFEPNLIRREMVKKINDVLVLTPRNPNIIQRTHVNQFWQALRERQRPNGVSLC
jgi:hypothetical protein